MVKGVLSYWKVFFHIETQAEMLIAIYSDCTSHPENSYKSTLQINAIKKHFHGVFMQTVNVESTC